MSDTILLIGGPMDLDDTEVPDNQGSIIKAFSEGVEHKYYVMRDWELNRWCARWGGPSHGRTA